MQHMSQKTYLVVGDDYRSLTELEPVTTSADVAHKVNELPPGTSVRLVLGQGLKCAQRTALQEKVGCHPAVSIVSAGALASTQMTHKHSLENVLISEPVRVVDKVYRCEMVLDSQADRLSDHVTGLHLAGMLLVEAGRQFSIAVLELEYGAIGAGLGGLMWSDLEVRFLSYAFPVPTVLNLTLTEHAERARPGQPSVATRVEITQAGQAIAEVKMAAVLAQDRKLLQRLERRRAQTVIQKVLAAHDAASPVSAIRPITVSEAPELESDRQLHEAIAASGAE
ncbi:MAG: hypothetical protein RL701_1247 [Pseudomonadota bacterium]|jgi:hypothetical protein